MKKTIATRAWDAELNTDICDPFNNADLTLCLKMVFRQINPPNGATTGTYRDYGKANSTPHKIINWNPAAWLSWKSSFVDSANKYWNGKFWLINNFLAYEYKYKETEYVPNVWCRFKLIDIDSGIGSHHQVDVVRLDKSESWFGSNQRLYDNLDINPVRKDTDSKGGAIMQRAHIHEIGHLLGLSHVDVGKKHCIATGDTNALPCYGVADRDKYAVMGKGMQLRDEYANPWRRAITQISGKGNAAVKTDWAPKRIRQYPRTLPEVAANASVTALPKR